MLKFLDSDSDTNDLNPEQKRAYKIMLSGANMFLTGPGGTGKSYLIEKYFTKATKLYGREGVAKTSTTGISALNIKGRTIHSWAGIGYGEDPVDDIIQNMTPYVRNNWRNARVLIIDEVSMLHPDILDKLYEISLRVRNQKDNLQFIFVGDPFQLPVVKCKKQFFEATCWPILIKKKNVVSLTKSMRQQDADFQYILNRIRVGRCTEPLERILQERVGARLENEWGIMPTRLHSTNVAVDTINAEELQKLISEGRQCHKYVAKYSVKYNFSTKKDQQLIDDFKKISNTDDNLVLVVGAQVMIKKNMRTISEHLVNGARGVVVGFEANELGQQVPIVRLLNGLLYTIDLTEFEHKIKGVFEVRKLCVPLKLAWACSIHSSQGLTLDYVEADLGTSIFTYGQSYVVLSRVRSIEGLTLSAFEQTRIKVHPLVLKEFATEVHTAMNLGCFPEVIVDIVIDYLM
jgi:ATP-dependent DNA helicase PIF1